MNRIKKIGLAAFIGLFGFSVNAQDMGQEVPAEVKESFQEEFASAKDVQWETEPETYEAEFILNGEEKKVHYDKSGEKKMVTTEIEKNKLPKAVQQTLNKDYAGYESTKYEKVEKEGMTKYKIELKKDGMSQELMLDSSGKKIEKDKKDPKSKM